MIDRRRFLEITLAMAALTKEVQALAGAAELAPGVPEESFPHLFVPEEAAVARWLEWYKAFVGKSFPDVAKLFPLKVRAARTHTLLGDESVHVAEYWEAADEDALTMIQNLEDFEHALRTLETQRQAIAVAHGLGYDAGRENAPRECRAYDRPSNECYSWYNGWSVGHGEYESSQGRGPPMRMGMGVYFPPGHPKHKPRG